VSRPILASARELIPTGAIRLAALGLLASGPRRYDELAVEVRRFASRMLGPSLDILGTSIEALRYEGLIEGVGPRGGPGQSLKGESIVEITEAGRRELAALLASPIRAPMTDLAKLFVALKLKFFDLIAPAEQRRQLEMLIELSEAEIARLTDLRRGQAGPDSQGDLLGAWLDQDIAQAEQRRTWYRARLAALS